MSSYQPRMMMIDLETLGVTPKSVVFQLGYTIFTESEIYARKIFHFNPLSQLMKGRSVEKGAVEFWQQQPETVWKTAKLDFESTAAIHLRDDWKEHSIQKIWANSPAFDLIIWEDLCRDFGLTVPWSHKDQMDMRTLKQIGLTLNISGPDRKDPTHNALQDAIDQTEFVQIVLRLIRAKTK